MVQRIGKTLARTRGWSNPQPDNPRESMEPSSLDPSDARLFFHDIMLGAHGRMRDMDDDKFTDPRNHPGAQVPNSERAKQYYGNDVYQYLSGVQAALREWDSSGEDVKELKEKYGGEFVSGVELGERLAVYEGRDFTFVG